MDKGKKAQIIVLAGLALTVIALFLTLYKAKFMGTTYSDSIYNAYSKQGKTGLVFLFLAAPIIASLFILLKKRIPVIIFGVLQCGLWALLTKTFKDEFANVTLDFSYSSGYYVGLIGAILIVLGGIFAIATKAFKNPK